MGLPSATKATSFAAHLGADAAGQVQIQQRADDVLGTTRLLLVQEPGRVEGPGRWSRAVIGRERQSRLPGTSTRDVARRAHRQGLGEVVALQHGGGVQPGLAARPALDVGRGEQRLAHRRQPVTSTCCGSGR